MRIADGLVPTWNDADKALVSKYFSGCVLLLDRLAGECP